MPLLNTVQFFIKVAQSKDVFMCDFITTINIVKKYTTCITISIFF
jgi:hypothetical protein